MSVLNILTVEQAPPARGRWSRALTTAALALTVCAGTASTGLTAAHASADPTVSKEIQISGDLTGVAFSPDGTQAYVPNIGENGDGTVSVITVATGAVTNTIAVGSLPAGVAFSPDGTQAYVPNSGGETVSVIAVATGTVTGSIWVGTGPEGVAFSPDGTQAYVSRLNGTVAVVTVATGTLSKTIIVGSRPEGVAFSPDGAQVYVPTSGENGEGTVSVITVATATVTGTVPVGTYPSGVAFSPDGTQVYVLSISEGTLSVIQAATGTVSSTLTVDNLPSQVAFSPDGTQAYVTSGAEGEGAVFAIATGLAPTATGSTPGPAHVAVDGPATVNPTPNAAFLITGTAPAGATVTLHFHKAGTPAADYSIVRSVTAADNGTWSRSITASSDYRYYATVPGATSATVLFQPAPTLNGPTSRVVPVNRRYTLTGTAVAGSTVFLHFHRRGTAATDYSIVRSVTAAADGTWKRSYLADTDYRVFTSRTAGSDSSDGPRYLLQVS